MKKKDIFSMIYYWVMATMTLIAAINVIYTATVDCDEMLMAAGALVLSMSITCFIVFSHLLRDNWE